MPTESLLMPMFLVLPCLNIDCLDRYDRFVGASSEVLRPMIMLEREGTHWVSLGWKFPNSTDAFL